MTIDNCAKMPNMVFTHEICGNKYYVNQDTSQMHCCCGEEADFPHDCKDVRYKSKEPDIDWELNLANSIAGQILNNKHCKENYARILAIAMIRVHDALRAERVISRGELK